ncbi:receptor-type tyrosine-protein phosphatase F-like [Actinia tenebrosa]|uniref:Receptor-type tyrosine-protein phosphatase F-like n=1 Tax=Actinia tenebrosa TaxID=6105 RepID=A0A6P8IXW3_ACTTE|nr:receptor-type tyrosine-protein phosphatase F-like [Actinia tenebrosa]
MRVRIVQCPCLNGGQCVPHPYHPRGSGLYQCKCVNEFSGDTCERCPGLVCPPRNLSVTTLSSTKIQVEWVEPQDKALDYYLLEYGPKEQKPKMQRISKTMTSYTLTELRKFTDYRIGVSVVNADRTKKVEVSAKTAEDVPDAPPLITDITPISHDTMKVTWSPIAEDKRNGIIKGYRIYYKAGLPGGNWGKWKSLTIREKDAKSAIVSRLKPATSYCFKMSAFTRKGQYRLWMTSECWMKKTALYME